MPAILSKFQRKRTEMVAISGNVIPAGLLSRVLDYAGAADLFRLQRVNWDFYLQANEDRPYWKYQHKELAKLKAENAKLKETLMLRTRLYLRHSEYIDSREEELETEVLELRKQRDAALRRTCGWMEP